MDPLVPAFLTVLLAETGSKTQAYAHALGIAKRAAPGLFVLIGVSFISYSVAAAAGFIVAARLPLEARGLLFAVALLASGAHMLTALRPAPAVLPDRRFGGIAFGFFKAQFGDDAQFLVFALAAKSGLPAFAAAGGLAGVLVACLMPMAAGLDWPTAKLRWARRCIAAFLMLWGFLSAVRILGLSTAI
jgi:Ca2+/H+ antiporter, TMEM165/GDT1 family